MVGIGWFKWRKRLQEGMRHQNTANMPSESCGLRSESPTSLQLRRTVSSTSDICQLIVIMLADGVPLIVGSLGIVAPGLLADHFQPFQEPSLASSLNKTYEADVTTIGLFKGESWIPCVSFSDQNYRTHGY